MSDLLDEEIRTLTGLWYEYVSLRDHSDSACRWYIIVDYAYGNDPTYVVRHYGGIAKEVDMRTASLQEAKEVLKSVVKSAILDEQDKARKIVAEGVSETGWDEGQVSAAEFILDLDTSIL